MSHRLGHVTVVVMTYVASLRMARVQSVVISAKKGWARPPRVVRRRAGERPVFDATHQRLGCLSARFAYLVRRNYHRQEGDSRRSPPITAVVDADTTYELRQLVRRVQSAGNFLRAPMAADHRVYERPCLQQGSSRFGFQIVVPDHGYFAARCLQRSGVS